MSDGLTEKSIGELALRLQNKDISPVELTRSVLKRIEDVDYLVNAFLSNTTRIQP